MKDPKDVAGGNPPCDAGASAAPRPEAPAAAPREGARRLRRGGSNAYTLVSIDSDHRRRIDPAAHASTPHPGGVTDVPNEERPVRRHAARDDRTVQCAAGGCHRLADADQASALERERAALHRIA